MQNSHWFDVIASISGRVGKRFGLISQETLQLLLLQRSLRSLELLSHWNPINRTIHWYCKHLWNLINRVGLDIARIAAIVVIARIAEFRGIAYPWNRKNCTLLTHDIALASRIAQKSHLAWYLKRLGMVAAIAGIATNRNFSQIRTGKKH
jgi:hypothetical protein